MIRRAFRVLLVVAALASSESVAGAPAGTILRLCADPDNLPFSSATGPERGLYIDVGALVAARLGMTTDVVWWHTAYGRRAVRNTLLAETCDAYVGLPVDAGYMERQVSVTRPFVDVGYAIMAPPSVSFARLDDLKPHRVAVEFRTPAQSLLATREGFSVSTYRSTEEAVDALARTEVDAAFVWGPIAGYLNLKKFAGAYRVVPVAGEGMQWRVGIGVRKSEEALRRRIDDALSQLAPEIRRTAEQYGFPLAAAIDLTASAPPRGSATPVASEPPPTSPPPVASAPTATSTPPPPDAVAAGRAVFNQHCSHCHSPNAHSPEPARDLRRLRMRYGERMSAVFYETITEGRSAKGMPPWKEILKADDIARILSFLESVQSSP
jgi:ABC-type amino acid transport substrate-binding protein/cytochrome c5